jgi:hypothetical protein
MSSRGRTEVFFFNREFLSCASDWGWPPREGPVLLLVGHSLVLADIGTLLQGLYDEGCHIGA